MPLQSIYESVHKDVLLTEWLRPRDADALRPPPPPPPDGFHATLRPGDAVEVYHESAWWPVEVRTVHGPHSFGVGSDAFAGLCRKVASTHVRPRWRFSGAAAVGMPSGGWVQLTRQGK